MDFRLHLQGATFKAVYSFLTGVPLSIKCVKKPVLIHRMESDFDIMFCILAKRLWENHMFPFYLSVCEETLRLVHRLKFVFDGVSELLNKQKQHLLD